MNTIVLTKSLLFSSRPRPSVEPVFNYHLANCPGKSAIGMRVKFPPGGASPPHRHGGASVAAVVLEGVVLNKMNDDPMRVVETGGSWYEAPGCHHKISSNKSETEPAVIFATFVVETSVFNEGGYEALVVVDEEYRDIKLV
jgi:quercetin dioxygenase-like cupin family protein